MWILCTKYSFFLLLSRFIYILATRYMPLFCTLAGWQPSWISKTSFSYSILTSFDQIDLKLGIYCQSAYAKTPIDFGPNWIQYGYLAARVFIESTWNSKCRFRLVRPRSHLILLQIKPKSFTSIDQNDPINGRFRKRHYTDSCRKLVVSHMWLIHF